MSFLSIFIKSRNCKDIIHLKKEQNIYIKFYNIFLCELSSLINHLIVIYSLFLLILSYFFTNYKLCVSNFSRISSMEVFLNLPVICYSNKCLILQKSNILNFSNNSYLFQIGFLL